MKENNSKSNQREHLNESSKTKAKTSTKISNKTSAKSAKSSNSVNSANSTKSAKSAKSRNHSKKTKHVWDHLRWIFRYQPLSERKMKLLKQSFLVGLKKYIPIFLALLVLFSVFHLGTAIEKLSTRDQYGKTFYLEKSEVQNLNTSNPTLFRSNLSAPYFLIFPDLHENPDLYKDICLEYEQIDLEFHILHYFLDPSEFSNHFNETFREYFDSFLEHYAVPMNATIFILARGLGATAALSLLEEYPNIFTIVINPVMNLTSHFQSISVSSELFSEDYILSLKQMFFGSSLNQQTRFTHELDSINLKKAWNKRITIIETQDWNQFSTNISYIQQKTDSTYYSFDESWNIIQRSESWKLIIEHQISQVYEIPENFAENQDLKMNYQLTFTNLFLIPIMLFLVWIVLINAKQIAQITQIKDSEEIQNSNKSITSQKNTSKGALKYTSKGSSKNTSKNDLPNHANISTKADVLGRLHLSFQSFRQSYPDHFINLSVTLFVSILFWQSKFFNLAILINTIISLILLRKSERKIQDPEVITPTTISLLVNFSVFQALVAFTWLTFSFSFWKQSLLQILSNALLGCLILVILVIRLKTKNEKVLGIVANFFALIVIIHLLSVGSPTGILSIFPILKWGLVGLVLGFGIGNKHQIGIQYTFSILIF